MSSTVLPCSGIATWFPFFFHQSWPCTGRRKMCSSPWLPSWVWMSRWGHRLPQVKARIWKIEHVTMQHPTWCFFGRGSYILHGCLWCNCVIMSCKPCKQIYVHVEGSRHQLCLILTSINIYTILLYIYIYINTQVKGVSGVSVPFHPKPQGIYTIILLQRAGNSRSCIYIYIYVMKKRSVYRTYRACLLLARIGFQYGDLHGSRAQPSIRKRLPRMLGTQALFQVLALRPRTQRFPSQWMTRDQWQLTPTSRTWGGNLLHKHVYIYIFIYLSTYLTIWIHLSIYVAI